MKVSTDYLLTLAYLMGERTIQSSTTAPRTTFVQSTLEEIYRAYKWPFAKVSASLAVSGGVASLPSTYDAQHGVEGYFYSGTDQIPLDPVGDYDQVNFLDGDYRFWTEAQADGTFLLKTKDTIGSVTVNFQTKAPTVAASVASAFDDTMTVALGARRYIKLSQDPNADISQDEALFQRRLTENIAAVQVGNPKRKIRFLSQARGYRVGGGFDD